MFNFSVSTIIKFLSIYLSILLVQSFISLNILSEAHASSGGTGSEGSTGSGGASSAGSSGSGGSGGSGGSSEGSSSSSSCTDECSPEGDSSLDNSECPVHPPALSYCEMQDNGCLAWEPQDPIPPGFNATFECHGDGSITATGYCTSTDPFVDMCCLPNPSTATEPCINGTATFGLSNCNGGATGSISVSCADACGTSSTPTGSASSTSSLTSSSAGSVSNIAIPIVVLGG